MNRRQFLQVSLAAATLLLLRKRIKTDAAAPLPSITIPDPTPPQGRGMMTIPFFVGRPRDEKVFMPVIQHK